MPRLLKRLLVLLVALCALLVAGYVFRAPLLHGAASAWIVNEPLAKANVIVVLGGGRETRPFEAAKLYHQGLAPKILIMDAKREPTTLLGLTPSDAEFLRQILSKQGVPASALVIVGNRVANTYEESLAVRDWERTNAIKCLIIPTDMFHTRRVRWLFRKQLRSAGVQVIVEPVAAPDYTAADWWRHEDGLIAFQNELLKFAYYRIKY